MNQYKSMEGKCPKWWFQDLGKPYSTGFRINTLYYVVCFWRNPDTGTDCVYCGDWQPISGSLCLCVMSYNDIHQECAYSLIEAFVFLPEDSVSDL